MKVKAEPTRRRVEVAREDASSGQPQAWRSRVPRFGGLRFPEIPDYRLV